MGVLVEKVRFWVCLGFLRLRNWRRSRRNLAAFRALTSGKTELEIEALADELEARAVEKTIGRTMART